MRSSAATIDSATRQILTEVAPHELPMVEMTAEDVLAPDDAGRRARLLALGGGSRATRPTEFGGAEIGMLAGFVVTVLSGVASEVLKDEATDRVGKLRQRWRRRRQRRAIADTPAAEGPATVLPALPALQARQIGDLVRGLALDAGIAPEPAERVTALVVAALLEK